jgi:hypothetical protein
MLALFKHHLVKASPARPSGQRSRTVRQRPPGVEKSSQGLLAPSVAPAVNSSPVAPRRLRRSRQSSHGIS